jgi:branched-subunit amino acid permease
MSLAVHAAIDVLFATALLAFIGSFFAVPLTAWISWRRGDYVEREGARISFVLLLPLTWVLMWLAGWA